MVVMSPVVLPLLLQFLVQEYVFSAACRGGKHAIGAGSGQHNILCREDEVIQPATPCQGQFKNAIFIIYIK
jgi:hypothetical protein